MTRPGLVFSDAGFFVAMTFIAHPQSLSFETPLRLRSGAQPVSYTHLTLPTNREV